MKRVFIPYICISASYHDRHSILHQTSPPPSRSLALPTMSSSPKEVVEKLPSTEELKEDVAKATKKSLQSLRDFAAGGVGGVFAVVVGHPFDLVKVRMQTAEKGVYTGAMDVVKKTIAKEGMARVRLQPCVIPRDLELTWCRVCMLAFLRHWLV